MNDDQLLEELRAAAVRSDSAGTGSELDAPLGDTFEASVAERILKSRARRRPVLRRAIAVLPALAIAAAFAFWMTSPRSSATPLPPYAVEVVGQQDVFRGTRAATDSGEITASADQLITLRLRPARDVSGPLAVHVFAWRDDQLREVTPTIRLSPSGAVEVTGTVKELVGVLDASLVVVVERAAASVDARTLAERGGGADGSISARVRIHVR